MKEPTCQIHSPMHLVLQISAAFHDLVKGRVLLCVQGKTRKDMATLLPLPLVVDPSYPQSKRAYMMEA